MSLEESCFALIKKRAGRDPSDAEKAHIRYYLDADEKKLPAFLGYESLDDLKKAIA